MTIADLDTPALIADLDIVQRNIDRMAELARRGGKALRPHLKTHKCPDFARLQIVAGSAGVTVAKLAEAETMADAGIDDLFVANVLAGSAKAERLAILARRARVAVGVDSVEVAAPLSLAASRAGIMLPVHIEVDTGLGRCGVRSAQAALDLARAIDDLPGLRLAGLYTHEGHVYRATLGEAVAACAIAAQRMRDAAHTLRTHGLPCETVSVGSTPGAAAMSREPGIDELRPGVYIFNDRMQVELGSAREDDCALSVLATVISRPEPDMAILDAGSKALSGDRGERGSRHGAIAGLPEAAIDWLSEEHAHVDLRETAPSERPRVGDRVRVVPYHACACVNLHAEIVAVRGERVESALPVAARGQMR